MMYRGDLSLPQSWVTHSPSFLPKLEPNPGGASLLGGQIDSVTLDAQVQPARR